MPGEIKIIQAAIVVLLAIPTGIFCGYYLRKFFAAKQKDSVEAKIEKLLLEAKNKEQDILYKAKERSLNIIQDGKQELEKKNNELDRARKRLEQREGMFDQKLLEFESKKQELLDKAQKVEKIKEEIKKIKEDQYAKLEKIAQLNKDDAQRILLDNVEREMKETLTNRIRKIQDESAEEIERKARGVISLAIQRCASSHAAETTNTIVNLPSDEMKGRIIGREGRNIRTIEQLTGVEIVVDDTPNAITISGFSPIRRHVAKRALEKLILDGRIHPTKIEDAIQSAKEDLALDIKKAGEDAIYETGIAGLDPKLVQILGRLKYRTSYGQNVLQHSIEVAHLSALLAEELKANVAVAKKAGILHDIGKAVDHEIQGTHPEIGRDIVKRFNLPENIIIPIATHHDDHPPTLEAIIVKAADAISGARPGARKDSYEFYLQRLDELEQVAKSFDGVEKVYAIQAGREVRVFVTPEKIDDLSAQKLAANIARKIEEELRYPGEIKVNVIRETRVIEYAR
ncbi:MAG: ribonuclease Y [bacterium]